jgi:hypothetical protein
LTPELSIEVLVRQAMVEVARLATSGGARTSLARLSDQVFLELTRELERQGVTKNVVADMFGMSLRTFHRRVRQLGQLGQEQVERRTVREAVLEVIRASAPVTAHAVHQRFLRHPAERVAGAMNDLVHAGLVSRTGWGDKAVYRAGAVGVPGARSEPDLGRREPVCHVRVAG